ncbi:alkaline phosphatase D family protein [Nocardioides campestrisoli]|uniref:alkaline phosphatase D family protein n=1 Tax=Nocardioides campestrisoli TaxID=2736757 RepID=UPI00163D4679|nr:alkaline phosphatase D family protein [Nocardioides campestrisoli]
MSLPDRATTPDPAPALVLGPLLRYVDETSATIWVETDRAAVVKVDRGGVTAEARTFGVHGHHYALVDLEGLEPGSQVEYEVGLDGHPVWPEPGARTPAPVLATLDLDRPLRLLYGSCRTSVPHDAEGNRAHGVDALRAYALSLAGLAPDPDAKRGPDGLARPDLMLFLGDQVYADETTEEMREFIASRRDLDEPPGEELRDFEEYAHLYLLAWSDPVNRWLLSTVPSAMIFDDHDVRDDWNTSLSWRRKMEATSWWHGRIVAALASYWVYQHAGNLSPQERLEDPLWLQVVKHDGLDELDLSEALDAFAAEVDRDPEAYRWSYERDLGPQARLVVVDSRAARVLDPDGRAMLDPAELEWLDHRMRGDVEHLLIGTSVPFLLAPGLHHVEAFSEALAQGAWGRALGRVGESLRQLVDLEHWAAFQDSFQRVARMAIEVARGERGQAPSSVVFLSGDVHHSYVSQARVAAHPLGTGLRSHLLQAVCSPIRNPLPRSMRFATAALSYGVAGPLGRVVSRSAQVPAPPLEWRYLEGPWFDNNVAVLEVDGRTARMRWFTGEIVDEQHDLPRLATVAEHRVEAPVEAPRS